MADVTKQERARQVSESLRRWAESQDVRIMTRAGATAFTDDEDGCGVILFSFDKLGYGSEDEVRLA